MTRLDDSLGRLARHGQERYDQVVAPGDYAATYVAGVKRVKTRRTVVTSAMSIVAVMAVGAVGWQVMSVPDQIAPATPSPVQTPGDIVWKRDLGTEMWGSPVVVGTSVVVGGNDGVIRSVEIATGIVEWEYATAGPVRSTPVVHEDAVYVWSDAGELYALEGDGTLTWSASIAPSVTARDSYNQRSATPVVANSLVIVGTAEGRVVAVDRATGDQVWSADAGGPVWADLATDGHRVVAGTEQGEVRVWEVATGTQVWSVNVGAAVMSAPAIGSGVVVSGSRARDVVAFDADTGDERWSARMPGGSWAEAAAVIDGTVVYFGSSAAGVVSAVDLTSGASLWRSNVGGWPWARPVVADGVVYATSARTVDHQPWHDAVYAIDATAGTILWRTGTGQALEWYPEDWAYGAMTTPAVADGVVMVAGLDGVLYAFAR